MKMFMILAQLWWIQNQYPTVLTPYPTPRILTLPNTSGDPVIDFCERVNKDAINRSYWKDDFRRAHYDAFVEQAQRYYLEKYRKN